MLRLDPRQVLFVSLSLSALAACDRAPLGVIPGDAPPPGADAAVTPNGAQTEEEWRAKLMGAPPPSAGCFQAAYPGDWQAAPCTTAPNIPFAPTTKTQGPASVGPGPQIVGNSRDFSAWMPDRSLISWAEGSFPIVKGVTSVTGSTGLADDFSLQVNSNPFNSATCSGGSPGCLAWQQFIYTGAPRPAVFIEYWLLNYGPTCPPGPWGQFNGSCVKDSAAVPTATISAKNLAHVVLAGRAGSLDGVILSTGNGNLYAVNASSVVGLDAAWTTAEFNLFGNGGGRQSTFNAGSTVVVRTVTNTSPATTIAGCVDRGFTGETNNLTLVAASCCAIDGASPGIQFTESNVAGATAQPCPTRLQTAAVCGRSPTGLRCAKSNGNGFDQISLWSPYFADPDWNFRQNYATIQYADIDGDGATDVCGRSADGIACVRYGNGLFSTPSLWTTYFKDADGWALPQYYETIRFPDVNGDGKADVCGRASDGIHCALSRGSVFGVNNAATLWAPDFTDAGGWNNSVYYSTIAYPDLNGDGKADVCARGVSGVACALSDGTTFGSFTNWSLTFSDAAGWNLPKYYSTMKFPDLNADGKADVCARGGSGIRCALSTGTAFGSATVWAPYFSDANGFDQPQYYSTVAYADLNADGTADVCVRGGSAYRCALSSGTAFTSPTAWTTSLSNAAGWGLPEYYATLRLVDINHDGKADVCGRSKDGTKCATSTGTSFGTLTTEDSYFSDAAGWNTEGRYSTFGFLHEY